MLRRAGTHLRSNPVAYVALFFALGGGAAWALDTDSIESRHIAPDAVKGADVQPDSLKGVQISEASLNLPAAVAGIVNPDGSTQLLSPGLSVSRVRSGRYVVTIPNTRMEGPPVPVVTIISPESHRVEEQEITSTGSAWQITFQLTGGDHLFEFIAVEG